MLSSSIYIGLIIRNISHENYNNKSVNPLLLPSFQYHDVHHKHQLRLYDVVVCSGTRQVMEDSHSHSISRQRIIISD